MTAESFARRFSVPLLIHISDVTGGEPGACLLSHGRMTGKSCSPRLSAPEAEVLAARSVRRGAIVA